MIFSNSCKYAIRAVLYLAANANESDKIRVDDLADVLDIPKHFLAKILQQLTRHQIISSTKGRNGGFYLTKENESINLSTVIESIDGPVKMRDCILGLENCSDDRPCPYHFAVSDFKSKFYKQLRSESIKVAAARMDQSKLTIKNYKIDLKK